MNKQTNTAPVTTAGEQKKQAENKKTLLNNLLELTAQETAAARIAIKANETITRIIKDAAAEAFDRSLILTKRKKEDLTAEELDILTARALKIGREKTAAAVREIKKITAAAAPKYVIPEGLYNSYVKAAASPDIKDYEEFKTALKNALAENVEIDYSLKTCEQIIARIGLTRASLKERAEGVIARYRAPKDFARMLTAALFKQLENEGLHASKARAAKIAELIVKITAENITKINTAAAGF